MSHVLSLIAGDKINLSLMNTIAVCQHNCWQALHLSVSDVCSPGLPSYSTLRPLVYTECSAVLLCYTGAGLTGLETWVKEVSVLSIFESK